MPFKSKAQFRKFEKMEADGDLARGTTAQWLAETPNPLSLPERTKPKRAKRGRTSHPPKKSGFAGYR